MRKGEVIAAMSLAQGENNRRRVFGALERAGNLGVSAKELRHTLNLCESTVGLHLRLLRRDGLVVQHPRTGCSSRWYVEGTQPNAPPEVTGKRKRRKKTVSEWAETWAGKPIVRRVIPAAQAPRLVTKARGLWDV